MIEKYHTCSAIDISLKCETCLQRVIIIDNININTHRNIAWFIISCTFFNENKINELINPIFMLAS